MKSLTLYELNTIVRDVLYASMPDEYWVEAELSEVREVRGHCYMELIQKDDSTNTPIAKASAKCWKSAWMMARPKFESVTGQQMHAGMKVLLRVYAQFHENYGFSWIVTDIDPTYTMGDMARKRQEIIRILKEEGVFELNKELPIPMFAQRIAVISSPTAAGYGDFCNQLEDNAYGFKFRTKLFPAIMQGEQVEQSVIAALNNINRQCDDFDCVVIIRGGGATSDLSGFDTLALAENVANFPLPVITGIGHDRDESVLDMVSNTRVKTPTAAAAFLIDNLKSVLDCINNAQNTIARNVRQWMEIEKIRLNRLSSSIPVLFSVVNTKQESIINNLSSRITMAITHRLLDESHRIDNLSSDLYLSTERKMTSELHRLELLSQRINALNPELLLKRGYSITLHNGKAVRDPKVLKAGDKIITKVEKGEIISISAQG